jgi:ABC-2 type transport system ATP-binding protein
MIKVENVTKKFNGFTALDNVTFEVKQGEILGLLGPNGAGKTTTLRILTNYFNPTFGQIKYDNLDIIEDALKIRQKIGYLPENNPLYQDLKVKEYLTFAAQMHDIDKNEIKEAVKKVAEICGLKEKLNQEINKLSKGFKQRVGLAQALIHNPEILILDEPTEGLDPNQRIEIRDLIKKIGAEKTVILSSHVLSEVEATCDRVIIINKGKIVAVGSPAELKNQTSSLTKISLKVAGPEDQIINAIKQLPGVKNITKVKKENNQIHLQIETEAQTELQNKLAQLIVANGWELFGINREETSLEDIFVKLTKNN